MLCGKDILTDNMPHRRFPCFFLGSWKRLMKKGVGFCAPQQKVVFLFVVKILRTKQRPQLETCQNLTHKLPMNLGSCVQGIGLNLGFVRTIFVYLSVKLVKGRGVERRPRRSRWRRRHALRGSERGVDEPRIQLCICLLQLLCTCRALGFQLL